jgi:hypothetical protein
MLYLSDPTLCRLMRRHHVTIRLLAQRMDLPMKRVCFRRQHGLEDRHAAPWLAGGDHGAGSRPAACAGLSGRTRGETPL